MTSIIFNQETVITGYPKFNKDEVYFLEKPLADELVNRGVAEYFTKDLSKSEAKTSLKKLKKS